MPFGESISLDPGFKPEIEISQLEGSIRIRWIAKRLGCTEDEAIGSIMLLALGCDPGVETRDAAALAGIKWTGGDDE